MDLQASGELYLAFKLFQDKYVREPKETLTRAKQIHERFMKEIECIFQYYGICHHLEHAEGVRKSGDDDDFEPDVLMVVDKHDANLQVVVDDSRSGTAWLRLNRGEQPNPELNKVLSYWTLFGYIFGGEKYLDPNKAAEIFYYELKELINRSDQMKCQVVLSRHGMAIRMDVYPDKGVLFWGERLYSVNLVPAYKVGGALYVSTPYKRGETYTMTWKRSFSIHEGKNLSEGAKCVLHAIMVIRNREPELAPLTSYQLKTVLFYEMDEEDDWSDHSLVLRFFCVLRRLEISLSFGNLPHFFYRETNLFSAVSLSCLKNMRHRIKRIRSDEDELLEIFNL